PVAQPLRLVHGLVPQNRLARCRVSGQVASADADATASERPARHAAEDPQARPTFDRAGAPQPAPHPADRRAPGVAEPADRGAEQERRNAPVESSAAGERGLGGGPPVFLGAVGAHATAPTRRRIAPRSSTASRGERGANPEIVAPASRTRARSARTADASAAAVTPNGAAEDTPAI